MVNERHTLFQQLVEFMLVVKERGMKVEEEKGGRRGEKRNMNPNQSPKNVNKNGEKKNWKHMSQMV